jgi:hypothetical protein
MSLSQRNRLRHIVSSAAALLPAAGLAGSAQGGTPVPQISVAGDSVIVTDLAAGRATLQVTRLDARTNARVVIGQFSGPVSDSVPFTANTTVPDALSDPAGDCWQAGALHLPGAVGLTPDIRPGDTVAVVDGPTLTVGVGGGQGSRLRGPITGCAALSVFAQNAVTGAPSTVANTNLAVSGVAQPLATAVSVSASTGSRSTAPVRAVPADNGRWTATIPASQVARLAKGTLSVAAVFTVPDVSTGAAAHIAGTPRTVQKVTGPRMHGPGETRARPRHHPAKARSLRTYAKQQAATHGWTGAQWQALETLAREESGWDPCAVYPSRHSCTYAGAASCGVPQA